MSSDPAVYIAGIGLSPWSWPRSALPSIRTRSATHLLAISAGTKALLDAGVPYDHVDYAIGCGDLRGDHEVFYTFGKTGIPIHAVGNDSGLYAAAHFIKSGNAHCVLMIGVDQNVAVGIVFASESAMWRHPYLKDAAALVRGCALRTPTKGSAAMKSAVQEALSKGNLSPSDIQIVESNSKSALDESDLPRNVPTLSSTTSLSGLCELGKYPILSSNIWRCSLTAHVAAVWLLRGWTQSDSASATNNCLQCTMASNGAATATVLCRADGKAAPAYKEVEHKNDGRDRLGYNPATQTKEISVEDWESVKSRDDYSDERAVDKVRFHRKGGDRAALAKI